MRQRATEPGPELGPAWSLRAAYVATAVHEAAISALVGQVQAGVRGIRLWGAAGCGKTVVLDEARRRLRSPRIGVCWVEQPVEAAGLLAGLAGHLAPGVKVPTASNWSMVRGRLRLRRLQGMRTLLIVDGDGWLDRPGELPVLDRLLRLDETYTPSLTVVAAGPERDEAGAGAELWNPAIRLRPLSHDELAGYLDARLAAAGAGTLRFQPGAFARLHLLAGGIPRLVDRLCAGAVVAARRRGGDLLTAADFDRAAQVLGLPGALELRVGPGAAAGSI